jgi:hypothetical protein
MSGPARSKPPPAEPKPTHSLPADAWTPEERELLAKGGIDPVDGEAAVAWLLGEGPDPWRDESS